MYVVAGASGNTGSVVADTLLTQGKRVQSVLVRDAKRVNRGRRGAPRSPVAELDDTAAVTAALRGAEGAYLLLPPNMGSTDVRADNAKRTESLAKAVEASGVKHVVFLSSIGSQLAEGTGPILAASTTRKRSSAARQPT